MGYMAFAFCPDEGPPRLIRFVTLEGNILATLDRELNLLRIDRSKYEQLSDPDKQEVYKTHSKMILLEHPSIERDLPPSLQGWEAFKKQ